MNTLIDRLDAQKFERAASMIKSIAHPVRLAIVDLLNEFGELSVNDIAERLNLAQAVTSQHLILLKSKGALNSHKDGKHTLYFLAVPDLIRIIRCIENFCEN